jgi:hypothetical protein
MYYLKGINEVREIIQKAIGLRADNPCPSYSQLNYAYYNFLRKTSVFENYDFLDEIELYDFQTLQQLVPKYSEKYKQHYSTNSTILNARLNSGFFRNALKRLELMNAEIFNLSNFLIKIILLNHLESYIDGTTGETIGLSCMDFKDHFDEEDFIELIVHQMTHMILFMDDYFNKHMFNNDKDIMIDVGLKYVLGGTQFPIYIAFHSYLVGIEILNFRWQFNGLNYTGKYHGTTTRIVNGCESFQVGLKGNLSLFSSRAQSILRDAFDSFERIRMVYQSRSI